MVWMARLGGLCLLVGLALAGPARADWVYDVATLQCAPERNEVLVRMGKVRNGGAPVWTALPESLSSAWPADAGPDNRTCHLADGRQVDIQLIKGQAFAYGMNGGVPDYWISLWIDHRAVLSRYLVRAGASDQSGNNVSAILVTADALKICDAPNDMLPREHKVAAYAELDRDAEGCFRKPFDLADYPVDPVQKAGNAAAGTFTVAATYSEAFCRQFVVPKSEWNYSPWIAKTEQEVLIYGPPAGEPLALDRWDWKSDHYLQAATGMRTQWDEFDFDNDGQPDTVIRVGADGHYMDGEVIFFRKGHHPEAAASLAAVDEFDAYPAWAKENGFHLVSGLETSYRTDRYTHLNLFQVEGSVFLMAHPRNRMRLPTAIIYRYRTDPAHGWGWLDPVCMFQEILPNE